MKIKFRVFAVILMIVTISGYLWLSHISEVRNAVMGHGVLRQFQQSIQTFHLDYQNNRNNLKSAYPKALNELVEKGYFPSDHFKHSMLIFPVNYHIPEENSDSNFRVVDIRMKHFYLWMSLGGSGAIEKTN
jgi:predicted GNAT superfamily acetyltransferase